ncbi:glucose-6-phosphate isomerase [Shimia gijangensis]|uniref:Glucose-6-phosphate isomerase n=1 Tax=Shimia gijangensis TaxID=1470563 RepID=A0A1M6RJ35_9RHOB|nr:glucose-6-phosphate isomerase [Shimia gijangensis]SHK32367.1 glucose-6-phosphate isomerase [Shimia gijangensis]
MWNSLQDSRKKTEERKIAALFEDANRATDFSIQTDGLLLDYSKTNLDTDQRAALIALTKDVGPRRDAMFRGEKINETEGRAVLHTALRQLEGSTTDATLVVDGTDILAEVREVYDRMRVFAHHIRSGAWQGEGGRVTDVVNIGIGGSDLGPAMAVLALAPYADGPKCHFVSNVDGADLQDTLQGLNPKTTLIVVASKTFTTQETMMNAHTALQWMQGECIDPMRQFVAISSALDQTKVFGIADENVFGFGNWIGGRYSVWGPIGLSLMLAIGPGGFADFLKGGLAMDQHFSSAPPEQNMPVLLALVGLWHHKFCGYATRAVIPYEHRLRRLPAYLQQLEMESNGKGVGLDGKSLLHGGGPVVWGEPGTNGQHAFFQLLHQGCDVVPVEFLIGAKGHEVDLTHHHEALVANCLAQSEALLRGRTLGKARNMLKDNVSDGDVNRLASHRVFSGNRPSITLAYPKLSPFVLGQIIALYEHRVFVEGVVLGLNSFDQWGVELGKELASEFIPAVAGKSSPENTTASTQSLLDYVHGHRNGR